MIGSIPFYAPLCGLLALAIVLVIGRRKLPESRAGRMVVFVVIVLLPLLATVQGASSHMQRATSTAFCLSCHEMDPYWKSMLLDDEEALPAVHYQNRLVARDEACYTCHTSYTMFGDMKAKIRGVQHLLAHWFDPPEGKLELYEPYRNQECLHCHAGARSYEEHEVHADILSELAGEEISCLECHDSGHAIDRLEGAELWDAGGERRGR